LKYYLPTFTVTRHTADKPWLTDDFRRLVRKRQHAWTHGKFGTYKRLRNIINRLSKQLRQNFYADRIQNLHQRNVHNWWCQTKKLAWQICNSEIITLANKLTNGDFELLAEKNQSLIKESVV
jgi:hypothetical protein